MGWDNLLIGRIGEREALRFLKENGYRILERNFRTPFGEIDIVAERGRTLVFVEVKTRLTDSLGPPLLSVTKIKERRIIRNALFYMKLRRPSAGLGWRIDIISVKLDMNHKLQGVDLVENGVEDDGGHL
jgi:putative endonuclease